MASADDHEIDYRLFQHYPDHALYFDYSGSILFGCIPNSNSSSFVFHPRKYISGYPYESYVCDHTDRFLGILDGIQSVGLRHELNFQHFV